MGNYPNKSQDSVTLLNDPQSWVLVQNNSFWKKYRNQKTKQQVKEYIISADLLKNEKQQIQCYQYRKNNRGSIVQIFLFQKHINESKFHKNESYKVWVQFIKQRLSQINNLCLEQGLYILRQTLKGVRQIRQIFGQFQVTSKMIGINNEGVVKIWLSESFQLNKLKIFDANNVQSNKKDNNKESVTKIISLLCRIVGSCIKPCGFPINFSKKVQNSNSFQQVINFIQVYAKQSNLLLPVRIVQATQNKISLSNQESKRKSIAKQERNQKKNESIYSLQQINPFRQEKYFRSRQQQEYYQKIRNQQFNQQNQLKRSLFLKQNQPNIIRHQNYKIQNPESTLSFNTPIIQPLYHSAPYANQKEFVYRQQPQPVYFKTYEPDLYEQHHLQQNAFRKRSNTAVIEQLRRESKTTSKSFSEHQQFSNGGESQVTQNRSSNLSQTSQQKQFYAQQSFDKVQGIIRGSGIIQNIRSTNKNKKLQSINNNLVYQSPLQKSDISGNIKFNSSYAKRYSYTSCFDQQLQIRSGNKNPSINTLTQFSRKKTSDLQSRPRTISLNVDPSLS